MQTRAYYKHDHTIFINMKIFFIPNYKIQK